MRARPARRLLLLVLAAVVSGTTSPRADAGPPESYEAARKVYDAYVRRPSLEKRTKGRLRLAATEDPRARDVLIASYAKPEEPSDQVRHTIVSIVCRTFHRDDDAPAIAAWRAAWGRAEDAWLWYRALGVERSVAGNEPVLAAATGAADPCLRAAAFAVAEGDDAEILKAIVGTMATPAKEPFERALLVEACADALSKQAGAIGKTEFHDAAVKVIRALEDPATPPRTRLIVGRRLARTFSKPHAALEPKYWLQVLLAAEGGAAAPADDTYAQPKPPTFAGVPATGKRIAYLIDCSDSMLAPMSVQEVTQLKPKGEVTPGDDAGKLPPPPKPEDAPAKEPLSDGTVDWKRVKTRFDAAREMLKASVRALPPDAFVGVVLFGSKAELAKSTPGMVPVTPAFVAKLAAELDAMRPGRPQADRPYGTIMGNTNLHGALRRAYKLKDAGLAGPNEHVRTETFFQGCDTIFILSDGAPSYSDFVTADRRDPDDIIGDPETHTPLTPQGDVMNHGPYSRADWISDDVRRMNLLRKVEIHCVGIGEASGDLLEDIAFVGGGLVRRIAPEPKPGPKAKPEPKPPPK